MKKEKDVEKEEKKIKEKKKKKRSRRGNMKGKLRSRPRENQENFFSTLIVPKLCYIGIYMTLFGGENTLNTILNTTNPSLI